MRIFCAHFAHVSVVEMLEAACDDVFVTMETRERRTRSRGALPRALSGLLMGLCLLGCGGEGLDAPRTVSNDLCPEVDDYLEPVIALSVDGRFEHLQAVLGEDLPDDVRHDLVALIIELVGALEPGAVSALGDVELGADLIGELEETLAALTRWLGQGGPGAPYTDAFAFGVTALGTCDGDSFFLLVEELLTDEEFLRAALEVLEDPGLDVDTFLAGLDSPDGKPQSGLREFVRGLMTAATKEGFDVTEWTGLLAVLGVDVNNPPWSNLVVGLEGFLVPGPRLEAVQTILKCLLAIDPDVQWVDLLYDLLTAPPSLAISSSELDVGDTSAPLIPDTIRAPLEVVIATFKEDVGARQTLVRVLAGLLASTRVVGVLEDLTEFFEAGALNGIIEGLVAIATRSCSP